MPYEEYRATGPALARAVGLELVQRRAGDVDERGVAHVQVPLESVGHLVGFGGTARAALVPVRREHEVVDEQLATSVEQVEQRGLAVRTLDDVLPVDLDHREPAPVCVERVARRREFLLPGQQLLAGNQPLLP